MKVPSASAQPAAAKARESSSNRATYVEYDGDPDVDDNGNQTAHAGIVSHLCGRTSTGAYPLARDLLLSAVLSAFIAILSSVLDAACRMNASSEKSLSPRCMLGGEGYGSWLRLVAFSILVSVPARLVDKFVFAATAMFSQHFDSDTVNTALFFFNAFEGSISRFGSVWLVWGYGEAVIEDSRNGQGSHPIERIMQTAAVVVALSVLRNLLVRTVLRNVLVSSFEGKIQESLYSLAAVLSITQRHQLDAGTGKLLIAKDGEYSRVLRMYTSGNLRLKLDFISKARFRVYDKVHGGILAILRKDYIRPHAKAAFRRIAELPESAHVYVELGNKEEISLLPAAVGRPGGPPVLRAPAVGRTGSGRGAVWSDNRGLNGESPATAEDSAGADTSTSATPTPWLAQGTISADGPLPEDRISRRMTVAVGRARAGTTAIVGDALRVVAAGLDKLGLAAATASSPPLGPVGLRLSAHSDAQDVLQLPAPQSANGDQQAASSLKQAASADARGVSTKAVSSHTARRITAATFRAPDVSAAPAAGTDDISLAMPTTDAPGLAPASASAGKLVYEPWPELPADAVGRKAGDSAAMAQTRSSIADAGPEQATGLSRKVGTVQWLEQQLEGVVHGLHVPSGSAWHTRSIGGTVGRRIGEAMREIGKEAVEMYDAEGEGSRLGAAIASPEPGAIRAPKPQNVRLSAVAACLDPADLEVDKLVASMNEAGAMNGEISKEGFITWVEGAWTDFKTLKASLNGQKSVVTALSNLIDAGVLCVATFIALLIFEVDIAEVFIPLGTILVSASFAIGSAITNMVNSLIFVLRGPYHVGDRVTVSGHLNGDEMLIVRRIDLLTTTFLRPTNREITIPNWLLHTFNIENLKRSPPAVLRLVLAVHTGTTAMQLEGLRRRVNAYLDAEPAAWKPGCTIRAMGIRDQAMDLTMWLQSRYLWQDVPRLFKAHFALWVHVLQAMREEGIAFKAAEQQVKLEGSLQLHGAVGPQCLGGTTVTASNVSSGP